MLFLSSHHNYLLADGNNASKAIAVRFSHNALCKTDFREFAAFRRQVDKITFFPPLYLSCFS